MLSRRLLVSMLGVDPKLVRVDGAVSDPDGSVVVWLRPKLAWRWRCGRCLRRQPGYDAGRERRWRSLDFGRVRVFVACRLPRVRCGEHGVVTAAVPWARHGARHTRGYDDMAAWAAVEMSATAAAGLLRCSWRTIGRIVARVSDDLQAAVAGDGLDGLTRIGVDEISYKRGHRYLLVVVDHHSRRLVWARPGRDRATLRGFFDELGADRAARLTHVSADGASWISSVVTERAPQAVQCADPFHVVAWATAALDELRRDVWNTVRTRQPRHKPARGPGQPLKHARWALWKNPENLTEAQRERLRWIAATHPVLYRAWRLKEGLRMIFTMSGEAAVAALAMWLGWAARSRIPAFVKLGRSVRAHRERIIATLTHGLTNALSEAVNTRIRLITRRAYGFHRTDALIALLRLSLGQHRPQLPT